MTSDVHESPFTVAIIGGGITGLTLAVAHLRRHVRFQIYEQASKFGEIGAGVSFGPNAVSAMKLCDEGVLRAFEAVATHNQWTTKRKVYFDWVDGFNKQAGTDEERYLFSLENELGASSAHRAAFIEGPVELVPEEHCHFGKHLDTIDGTAEAKLCLAFSDATSATVDAVIACDGIKSRVRQLLFGEDSPISYPHYTYKYAYRGLIPMEDAVRILGEESAQNGKMHMGPDGHVLTFPVKGGSLLNIVAFRTDANPWPDEKKLTVPADKSTAVKQFEGWGPKVVALINVLKDDLDCWGIFDTLDHPVPTFAKGCIVLCGDAAHATSPHHGSGGGMCCEDSAILADLLSAVSRSNMPDQRRINESLSAAFQTFDECRRERTQWLVESSRLTGDLFEWRAEGVGSEIEKIKAELAARHSRIWNIDLTELSATALTSLTRKA